MLGLSSQNLAKAVQDSLAKANNVAEETISSMRTVRSFANEATEVDNYVTKLAVTLRLCYKEAVLYGSWVMANNVSDLAVRSNLELKTQWLADELRMCLQ